MNLKSGVNSFYFNFPVSLIFCIDCSPIPKTTFLFQRFLSPSNYIQFINFEYGLACSIVFPNFFSLAFLPQAFFVFFYTPFFFKHFKSIIRLSFKQLSFSFKTIIYGHYHIIQFVGFRYRQRWFRSSNVLRFRLGYNKKVWVRCPVSFCSVIRKISPKKRTHFFFAYDFLLLRLLTTQIFNVRPATLYKGRGVNIKEQPMLLKEGKRALW